ncbi:MAG: type I pullulanase [Candidatus Marinimicrobia bacterium]|nr:type I pullulanase [Candidatus Neomarinimicrobiota bacterium]
MKKLTVHYHRYMQDYEGWTLWSWTDSIRKEIKPVRTDNYGLVFEIDITDFNYPDIIGLLPKYKNWENKDTPERFWTNKAGYEIWLIQSDKNIYQTTPDLSLKILNAFLDGENYITATFTHPLIKNDIKPSLFSLILKNKKIKPSKVDYLNPTDSLSNILTLKFNSTITIDDFPANIYYKDLPCCVVHIRDYLVNEKFYFDGKLGLLKENDSLIFRLFAPSATEVKLNIYESARGKRLEQISLEKRDNGVWEIKLPDRYIGEYYTYSVAGLDPHHDPTLELTDPYSACVTAPHSRSKIYFDNTKMIYPPDTEIDELIIYEVHVRDFSISDDSGIKAKGKFLGFCEEGTNLQGQDISTGIDHLKELGINAVHLLPVSDFDNDEFSDNYNWGYMPVNFNSPDGWYATNPEDESRVIELKKLINSLHKNGIKVILDMVYNHTAEGSPEVRYNFNGIVPHFYYREKPDGTYWNGSGCGNEVRSENPMVRKFIIDSMIYWVKEYNIDGFRLDLMGLIDLETLKLAVKELKKIRPDIFIYGEPWIVGETPIKPTLKGDQKSTGIAVFNDNFRDAIKGPWYNTEPGYIQQAIYIDKIKKGIIGSITDFTDSPLETINYVACHDGRTLWDRIQVTTQNEPSATFEQKVAMHKLAIAIILTSQGIPFIHAGDEFLRTKFGEHNSYNLPDEINKIRWSNKEKYYDVFNYVKGLIKIRKEHPAFRMKTKEDILQNLEFFEDIGLQVPENCIAYWMNGKKAGDSWEEIIVLINPNRSEKEFILPDGEWSLIPINNPMGNTNTQKIIDNLITVDPISLFILSK